jgi:hypothetical protein
MSLGAERSSVQNPFIRYAVEAGWCYLSPDDVLRLQGGGEPTPNPSLKGGALKSLPLRGGI